MFLINRQLTPEVTPDYIMLRYTAEVLPLTFPDSSTVVTQLPIPQNLVAVDSGGVITLFWAAVPYEVQVWRTEYRVPPLGGLFTGILQLLDTVPANSATFVDSTKLDGSEATYYLVAVDNAAASEPSETVRVAPATPTLTGLTINGTEAFISWPEAIAPGRIYRQDLTAATPPVLVASPQPFSIGYTDTTWNSANETIWYRTTVGFAGPDSDSSNTLLANPADVTDLVLVETQSFSATLAWTATPGAVYQVWRSEESGPFEQVGLTAAGDFVDGGFNASLSYEWYVIKSAGSQSSGPSNTVSYSAS